MGRGGERRECVRRGGEISVVAQNGVVELVQIVDENNHKFDDASYSLLLRQYHLP